MNIGQYYNSQVIYLTQGFARMPKYEDAEQHMD